MNVRPGDKVRVPHNSITGEVLDIDIGDDIIRVELYNGDIKQCSREEIIEVIEEPTHIEFDLGDDEYRKLYDICPHGDLPKFLKEVLLEFSDDEWVGIKARIEEHNRYWK